MSCLVMGVSRGAATVVFNFKVLAVEYKVLSNCSYSVVNVEPYIVLSVTSQYRHITLTLNFVLTST